MVATGIHQTSNPTAGARFGLGPSLLDDTVLAAAPQLDPDGAAYLFRRTGSTWSEQAILTPPTSVGNVVYGTATALGPGLVVVSDPERDISGAVYVYQ